MCELLNCGFGLTLDYLSSIWMTTSGSCQSRTSRSRSRPISSLAACWSSILAGQNWKIQMEKSTFSNSWCIECGGKGFLLIFWNLLTIFLLDANHSSAFFFAFRRRFRIWPPYLVVIACTLILPLFGSGPLWPESVKSTAAVCRKSWFYNLLFINNFQKPDEVVSG